MIYITLTSGEKGRKHPYSVKILTYMQLSQILLSKNKLNKEVIFYIDNNNEYKNEARLFDFSSEDICKNIFFCCITNLYFGVIQLYFVSTNYTMFNTVFCFYTIEKQYFT